MTALRMVIRSTDGAARSVRAIGAIEARYSASLPMTYAVF